MIDCGKLREYSAAIGVELTGQQLEQFDRYAQLLVEWNEKINLTAITEPGEIVIKHFVDSLLLLTAAQPAQGASVIDIGTGAGFPGVPVKIARPDLQLTLLDSLNKRILFLQELSQQLGQDNACFHLRAEDGARQTPLREQFDLASARAVAHLRELSEYCLPYVRVGGIFAALKGGEVQEELEQSRKAIATLGGKLERICPYTLPDGSKRSILLIKKISQTSTKYPRPRAKMLKNPLFS